MRSHEADRARIGRETLICREQQETFGPRLSDQHTVERIGVNAWKVRRGNRVSGIDRQFLITAFDKAQKSRAGSRLA
jgi:hypothetical protein